MGQKKILAVETPNDELGHYLVRLYFAEMSNVESFVLVREIVNFEHQSTKSQVLELNFRGGFGFFQEDQYKNNGIFNQITVLLSLLASVL